MLATQTLLAVKTEIVISENLGDLSAEFAG